MTEKLQEFTCEVKLDEIENKTPKIQRALHTDRPSINHEKYCTSCGLSFTLHTLKANAEDLIRSIEFIEQELTEMGYDVE